MSDCPEPRDEDIVDRRHGRMPLGVHRDAPARQPHPSVRAKAVNRGPRSVSMIPGGPKRAMAPSSASTVARRAMHRRSARRGRTRRPARSAAAMPIPGGCAGPFLSRPSYGWPCRTVDRHEVEKAPPDTEMRDVGAPAPDRVMRGMIPRGGPGSGGRSSDRAGGSRTAGGPCPARWRSAPGRWA